MSFWTALKGDAKKLWQFASSPAGQVVIGIGESAVEAALPASSVAFAIINKWGSKIIQAEAMAEAAGVSSGSGEQKAAIVLSDMTPVALQFAEQYGLPKPTVAVLASVNDDIVNILNKLTGTKGLAAPTQVVVK